MLQLVLKHARTILYMLIISSILVNDRQQIGRQIHCCDNNLTVSMKSTIIVLLVSHRVGLVRGSSHTTNNAIIDKQSQNFSVDIAVSNKISLLHHVNCHLFWSLSVA